MFQFTSLNGSVQDAMMYLLEMVNIIDAVSQMAEVVAIFVRGLLSLCFSLSFCFFYPQSLGHLFVTDVPPTKNPPESCLDRDLEH